MKAVAWEDGYSLIDILVAMLVACLLAVIAVPITQGSIRSQRIKGDTATLKHAVGLAKMRASSLFTRARLRVDLDADTYRVQIWDKTAAAWVDDGATMRTSPGVSFGFGDLADPPPNTQVAIAMSPECTDGLTADDAIADTACIVFNSRGLPVDSDGAVFGGHALYLIGDMGASAVTVTATPLVRAWVSPPKEASWGEQ
jgi:type II secretory pathway pseudopilin PulG